MPLFFYRTCTPGAHPSRCVVNPRGARRFHSTPTQPESYYDPLYDSLARVLGRGGAFVPERARGECAAHRDVAPDEIQSDAVELLGLLDVHEVTGTGNDLEFRSPDLRVQFPADFRRRKRIVGAIDQQGRHRDVLRSCRAIETGQGLDRLHIALLVERGNAVHETPE